MCSSGTRVRFTFVISKTSDTRSDVEINDMLPRLRSFIYLFRDVTKQNEEILRKCHPLHRIKKMNTSAVPTPTCAAAASNLTK